MDMYQRNHRDFNGWVEGGTFPILNTTAPQVQRQEARSGIQLHRLTAVLSEITKVMGMLEYKKGHKSLTAHQLHISFTNKVDELWM